MSWLQFLILSLATFRLTILISKDDGPGFIFWKLRKLPKKGSSLKEGISCPFCVSTWFGLPIAAYYYCSPLLPSIANTIIDGFLLGLALSAVAIILNQSFTKD